MVVEPPIDLGTLSDGRHVHYEPGGHEHVDTGRTNTFGAPITNTVERDYEYIILDDGVEDDRITVEPTDWGDPKRTVAEVLAELATDYGWSEQTAEALVLAHGTHGLVRDWPSEHDGASLVGIIESRVLRGDTAGHGQYVGLYHDGDQLVPHVLQTEPDLHPSRVPDDPTPLALPNSECRDQHTYDVTEHGGIEALVRHLEAENVWHEDGYPHDLSETEKVAAHNVEVHPDYTEHLRMPSYWVDSGGQKHRIH